MSKLRKWTSHVDNKVEWTRRDIVVLHKELANRISALDETRRESADLKIKLEQSEATKFMAQKSVTETMTSSHPQKNVEKFEKSDTVVEGNVQGDPSIYGNSKAPSQVRSVQIGATIEQSLASQSDNREIQQMADAPESISTFRAEEERLKNCCAELEAEILELRKENEKIVKERAEYENAIQRALLKGVSSLNVEALKVLRCTPIPNCCSPCPPTTTIEPMAKSTRDCAAPSATKSPSIVNQCKNNGSREVLNSTSGKRNCQSAGNSERKSRKSRDNNMLLLLHQKDAENFGIQTNSNNCENSTKKSSFCTGGNCGKYGKIC